MKTLKQFQVKARKPSDSKFGDFMITDIEYESESAVADFGNGKPVAVDVSQIMPSLRSYSTRTKKFYVRMI